MRRTLVATLMAGVALPAYAADLAGGLSGGYVVPQDQVLSPTPMVVGHLQVGFGYENRDWDFDEGDGFSEDEFLFEGAGRANFDLGRFNFELEVGGNSFSEDGNSISTIGTAGHLWSKFNNAALGVFGAVNFPSFGTIYTAGVEGEVYLGPVTLGADGTYNWADGNISEDFWTVRGWADFYLTPNTRIGGEVLYASYNDFTFDCLGTCTIDSDRWVASINGEHRFSGTPLSLWGEVNYGRLDVSASPNPGYNTTVWSGMIGLRVFLDGGMTLREHDMIVPWDGGVYDGTRDTLPYWFL